MGRKAFTLLSALAVLLALSTPAAAVTVFYDGYEHITGTPTGQTATADFSFIDGSTLQIVLTETTAAGNLPSGAAGVLTSVGFLLPGSVAIAASGSFADGSVTINTGSASVDFAAGSFGSGADVSGEWGAAVGGEAPINSNMGDWDFVSALTAHMTPFAGANLDGPAGLDGPQGGLMNLPTGSTANGGLGVIDNSVIITVGIDQTLSAAQQAAFLASVGQNSIVEWGSNAAFSVVPEPSSMAFLAIGLSGLFGLVRKRRSCV